LATTSERVTTRTVRAVVHAVVHFACPAKDGALAHGFRAALRPAPTQIHLVNLPVCAMVSLVK